MTKIKSVFNKSITTFLIASLCMLCGCQKQYAPAKEVEEFLNGGISAEAAFDVILSASYTSYITQQTKAGEVKGTAYYLVSFDKRDPENLFLHIEQSFTGERIENDVETLEVELKRGDAGDYAYITVKNGETKQENIEKQEALDIVAAVVYRNNGVYNEGGLYFGDFFMMNIYKYPAASFYVGSENDLCVFDEKIRFSREDIGNVRLRQLTKIDRIGLMHYNFERYESIENDFVLISETTAEYGLKQH